MRLQRRVKYIVEQDVLFIMPSQWTDDVIAPYRAFEGLNKGDIPTQGACISQSPTRSESLAYLAMPCPYSVYLLLF